MKNHKFRLTTAQLAEICNTSQGTVDRALHNRSGVSPKTKARILRVAQEYGYRPSGEPVKLIGIIVFDLYNDYFSELVMCLEAVCREAGYSAVVMFSGKDKAEEKKCLERLFFMGVDGIVLCPVNRGEEFSAYLQSFAVPVVTIGNRVEGISFAGIRDKDAMAAAAEHILDAGYKHIVYYSPVLFRGRDTNISAQEDRLAGFQKAIAGRDVTYAVAGSPEELAGIPGEASAILCSTDYYALQLIFSGKARGWGIMGIDNIRSVDYYHVRLDTIGHDSMRVARYAIENILQGGLQNRYAEFTLVRRGSV